MEHQIEKGQRIVLILVSVTLSISIAVVASWIAVRGTGDLLPRLFRLGFTIMLCLFLYQGSTWARWISTVLLSIAGIMGIISGLGALEASDSALLPLLLLLMAALNLSIVAALWIPASVRAFYAAKRRQAA